MSEEARSHKERDETGGEPGGEPVMGQQGQGEEGSERARDEDKSENFRMEEEACGPCEGWEEGDDEYSESEDDPDNDEIRALQSEIAAMREEEEEWDAAGEEIAANVRGLERNISDLAPPSG